MGGTTTSAYLTTTLSSHEKIPVIPNLTDLSGLVGAQIDIGYGVVGSLSMSGTACNNMLNNATYDLVHTIAVLGEPIKATHRPQRLRGFMVDASSLAARSPARPAMGANEAVTASCAFKVGRTRRFVWEKALEFWQ
jgi:hypothetical protein